MAFKENTTEEIKSRLNIVEVVGSYIKLDKAGTHWKANCPFHQERTPSFMVNEERNMWHCFGCSKGGDIFAFVMEIEGLQFREALTLLAERAGVELPQYTRQDQGVRDQKERLYEIMALATKFYEHQLWEGAGKGKILQYLEGRGLSHESIRTFRLGYAPDGWQHLSEFLMKKGYAALEIEQAGLVIPRKSSDELTAKSYQLKAKHYDRFRDRIMFPVLDILGRPIGFSARMAPGGDDPPAGGQAKYINTPETPLYHKSRALYGLAQAKQSMKTASYTIVVEGNVDVIALHQAGLQNTVAVSGTALTEEQLAIMRRYGTEVRLFFDMDGAGQKAARKSAELALSKELSVSLVALPFGKDAADMGKDDPEKLRQAVAQPVPAPAYFLRQAVAAQDLAAAEGKRAVVADFTTLLLYIKNPLERSFWIKELSRAIGIEERIVIGAVNQAFLAQSRRDGPAPLAAPAAPQALFTSRAERLAEEIIAILLASQTLRTSALPKLSEAVHDSLSRHPLFFFLVQAGEHDPLSLIEDAALKAQATRLVFRLTEGPELAGLESEAREEKLATLLQGYVAQFEAGALRQEGLRALERALDDAKARGDRREEKRLLAEFARLSSQQG